MKHLLTLLAAVCLTGLLSAQEAGPKNRPKLPTRPQLPAPAQLRVPENVRAAHAHLFDNRGHGNLVDSADARGQTNIVVEKPEPFGSRKPLSIDQIVEKMICSADVIVQVQIEGGESSTSNDQSWIFTDYVGDVRTILKDPAGHLKDGQQIFIARSGGHIQTPAGNSLRFDDTSFPPLQTNKKYVLFLRYIPESGQYVNSDGDASFLSVLDRLHPLTSDNPALDKVVAKYTLAGLSDTAKKTSCNGGAMQ